MARGVCHFGQQWCHMSGSSLKLTQQDSLAQGQLFEHALRRAFLRHGCGAAATGRGGALLKRQRQTDARVLARRDHSPPPSPSSLRRVHLLSAAHTACCCPRAARQRPRARTPAPRDAAPHTPRRIRRSRGLCGQQRSASARWCGCSVAATRRLCGALPWPPARARAVFAPHAAPSGAQNKLNKAQKETVKSFASVTETTCVRSAARARCRVPAAKMCPDAPPRARRHAPRTAVKRWRWRC
jgi:hypothetical protein